MASLRDLQEQGSAEIGVSMDNSPQTVGGATNLRITRRYKVRSNIADTYLFQIIDAAVRITDPTYPDAYLVKQSLGPRDEADAILTCVFCQIPTIWRTDGGTQPIVFPGVLPSSLMSPYDFKFRGSAGSIVTQTRWERQYFLGPLTAIPLVPLFQPVDQFNNRVSVLDDWTSPSSDEYVAMTTGRQEIVTECSANRWMGDIFERKTLYAIAK